MSEDYVIVRGYPGTGKLRILGLFLKKKNISVI